MLRLQVVASQRKPPAERCAAGDVRCREVIAEFTAAVVKASISPGSGAPPIVVEADAPKKCAKLGMESGKTSPGVLPDQNWLTMLRTGLEAKD